MYTFIHLAVSGKVSRAVLRGADSATIGIDRFTQTVIQKMAPAEEPTRVSPMAGTSARVASQVTGAVAKGTGFVGKTKREVVIQLMWVNNGTCSP